MSLRRSKGGSSGGSRSGSRHNSLNSSNSKVSSIKSKYKNPEEDADFSDVPDVPTTTEMTRPENPETPTNQMTDEIISRRRSSMIDFDTLRHDIFDEMNSLHGYLQLLKLQYPDNEDVQLAMSQCNNVITMVKNLRGIKIV